MNTEKTILYQNSNVQNKLENKKINKYEVVKIKKFPIPTLMMHENHLIIDSVSFAPRISYTKDETI